MNKAHRSLASTLLLAAALAGSLSACVPVVITGVGAGVLMASDRRTSGTYVEDEEIELKVSNRVSEKIGNQVHLNATSFNRKVLLTGEAPTAEIKAQIKTIAANVPNVTGVIDEVQLAGISSLTARSNDTVITSKVKARFVDASKFSAQHVKVVTEAGVVYLVGIVTQREADAAIEITRTTSGVRKVVNVMEIISETQARQIDNRQATSKSSAAPVSTN
jgi:osmotically-inducible protein OsmY